MLPSSLAACTRYRRLEALLGVLGLAAIALSVPLVRADPVVAGPARTKLSDGFEKAEGSIRDASPTEPLALVVDVESIDAISTESMLHAIEDRRRGGGSTVAVVRTASDGAAVVALSCDAMVGISGARLAGAGSDWCASPSRREDLARSAARLGRIPEAFGERLVESSGPFSWDKSTGFQKTESGAVMLASDGAVLELSAAQLEQTGLIARSFTDLAAAIAAVEAGLIRPRPVAGVAVATSGGARSGGAGVAAGASNPAIPSAPSAPAAPAAPATPEPSAVDMAKLSPKLAEYQKVLGEFKAKLREFDGYYRGVEGVWTSQHKSLKAIWRSKSEMTRDKDTKVRAGRLQQDIRELITRLESITRSIERICDDKRHPDVVRTSAGMETLRQLREAIQRNEVDDYDRYKPLAERLP